jgi:hypothetical protein
VTNCRRRHRRLLDFHRQVKKSFCFLVQVWIGTVKSIIELIGAFLDE